MSFSREGVTWPTEGGYRYGMFDCFSTGDDPEWDVEYTDDFQWVSKVYPTAHEAFASYSGANPGGYINSEKAGEYDAEAAAWEAREADRLKRANAWRRTRPLVGSW